jgi:hypothetical protein
MTYIKYNPEKNTLGDLLDDITQITDKENAKEYFGDYVKNIQSTLKEKYIKFGESLNQAAVRIAKSNIGYIAGYCGKETYERIMNLFDTSHPVFGTNYPTPEEAFTMGVDHGNDFDLKEL